jgi:hypothetical protein
MGLLPGAAAAAAAVVVVVVASFWIGSLQSYPSSGGSVDYDRLVDWTLRNRRAYVATDKVRMSTTSRGRGLVAVKPLRQGDRIFVYNDFYHSDTGLISVQQVLRRFPEWKDLQMEDTWVFGLALAVEKCTKKILF